jgi:two-component system OmpR family sensor kinase
MAVLDTPTVRRLAGQPFTVAAQGAGHDWRVLVQPLSVGSGAVTVAVSLDDVDATVSTVATIDLEVGVSVLALLGVLGFVAVRSSLRRLVEVERTAEARAAGDLSRRVPDADNRTEVGRLAAALNEMLTQIETAFAQRQASEAEARAAADRMRRFVAETWGLSGWTAARPQVMSCVAPAPRHRRFPTRDPTSGTWRCESRRRRRPAGTPGSCRRLGGLRGA